MSLGKRIGRWFESHPLMAMFNQPAFNKFGSLHPWVAHFGTAFFGLILALGTFIAIFVAISIHLSSRHLVQHGVESSAIIDDISILSYKSGKANRQMYETTLRYHFTARDACTMEVQARDVTAGGPRQRRSHKCALRRRQPTTQ